MALFTRPELRFELPSGLEDIYDINFSPDGCLLVAGGTDCHVIVFDLRRGARRSRSICFPLSTAFKEKKKQKAID
jgi:WD40 repeat protein